LGAGATALLLLFPSEIRAAGKPKAPAADLYAAYVWPPPPDVARIRLTGIVTRRTDVEAGSRFAKALAGAAPQGPYEQLVRPIGCAFDAKGRLLVSDAQLGVLFRFDKEGRRMDVFGASGSMKLKSPLGVNAGADGTIYVADSTGQRVIAYDDAGTVVRVYGRAGELVNPTDSALSPDGAKLYVTDSKANRIAVYETTTARMTASFGEAGAGEGEFNHPGAIATDRDGNLYVVDAINARIQILSPDGEFLEQLGSLGTAPGQFIRPKDIAIDAKGRVYVTDGAFNNVQIFNDELQLLTFVGGGGGEPGQFQVPGGIAVHGDEFAIVDQLGRRVQAFRHLDESAEAKE
jgi:DNA-binding beta-propeller fold protein YncE